MASTSGGPPTTTRCTAASGRTRRESRPGSALKSARLAYWVFVGLLPVAAVLRLIWARGAWFTVDDWDLLSSRTAGDMGDLFRGHYGHWITLPVLAYRLLWKIAGLYYLPYELFEIALYVGSAVMARVVMRRVGVRPWTAT